jgi:hypothetical protein
VVIATVFLTIIGMTGGFVLGERHRRALAAESPGQTTPAQPASTQSASTQPTSTPAAADGKILCPEATRQTAARLTLSTTLWQVMKIQTANGTTVWICQDDTGGYYYQGKTGGPDAALVEGKNGLFLQNVVHSEDREEYVATATNGNRFVVNRKQLQVIFADGRPSQTSVVVPSN